MPTLESIILPRFPQKQKHGAFGFQVARLSKGYLKTARRQVPGLGRRPFKALGAMR